MDLAFFFECQHGQLIDSVARFVAAQIEPRTKEVVDEVTTAKEFIRLLAAEGLLKYVVPKAYGGVAAKLDIRSICLIREKLAYGFALADVMFAMQGLGSYPITLAASDELKRRFLPRVANGEAIAAFAITEPDAGSDVGALRTVAKKVGSDYELNGAKTFITNAGIADFYTLFAKTDPAKGNKGISAFVIPRDAPGLKFQKKLELIDSHPIGELRLEACRVPSAHLLGDEGEGFKIAMKTLDLFRATVAAAALGMAQRAFDEALTYSKHRVQFGQPVSAFQGIQFKLAEMATHIDAARLLVYRAAWKKDQGPDRVTMESSMAKLFATEAAQQVIDDSLQIHGGYGLIKGSVVERLYREVRALRIYEGTSEIQKLVIANQLLK